MRITEISVTELDVITQLSDDGIRDGSMEAGGEMPETTAKSWLVALTDVHITASSCIHFLPCDLWPWQTIGAGSIQLEKQASLTRLGICLTSFQGRARFSLP